MAERRWHLYPDAAGLAVDATRWILDRAAAAISARGLFRIVLAGGTTPRVIYERLRGAEAAWPRWHVYFGDERCLPRGHEARNDRLADEAWLTHVPIPAEQIHAIPAERGPRAATTDYAERLRTVDRFDLVLLGLGEDGHTASLFPGHEHEAADMVVAVTDAPKAPPERVSLGFRALAATRAMALLVTGDGKRAALRRLAASDPSIPASRLAPPDGLDVLADATAAAGLVPFPAARASAIP